jgi:hypothetical protein
LPARHRNGYQRAEDGRRKSTSSIGICLRFNAFLQPNTRIATNKMGGEQPCLFRLGVTINIIQRQFLDFALRCILPQK